jgi:hypothetical protein
MGEQLIGLIYPRVGRKLHQYTQTLGCLMKFFGWQ